MKKVIMNILPFIIGILTFAVSLFAITFVERHLNEVANMKRDLKYYETTYKSRQGATSLWEGSHGEMLTYDLRSFDGGRNWYVIRRDGDNVYVQGNVENVYPGLLKHLGSMDELYQRMETNGPLNLGSTEDISLLKRIGFQIVSNSPAK